MCIILVPFFVLNCIVFVIFIALNNFRFSYIIFKIMSFLVQNLFYKTCLMLSSCSAWILPSFQPFLSLSLFLVFLCSVILLSVSKTMNSFDQMNSKYGGLIASIRQWMFGQIMKIWQENHPIITCRVRSRSFESLMPEASYSNSRSIYFSPIYRNWIECCATAFGLLPSFEIVFFKTSFQKWLEHAHHHQPECN